MQASIKNFMGVEKVELDISKIALVAGLNHQGKSSVCRAVSAALSGETVPLGLKKTEAGMLVRSGAAKSEVQVVTGEGSALVTWPKAERHTEGTPPYASIFATGGLFFPDLSGKESVDLLTDLMNAKPEKSDLVAALEMPEKTIDAVWASIDRDGWDLAHKRRIEKGREYKTQWNYVTKVNYGTKIAPSWAPSKWDDDLATKSQDALDANITACRAELEDAIAQQAIAGDELERLKVTADQKGVAEEGIAKTAPLIAPLENDLAALEKQREELPPVENDGAMECPHCGGAVIADKIYNAGTTLKKAEKIDEKEKRLRETNRASLDGKVGYARDQLSKAQRALSEFERNLLAAQAAVKTIAEIDGKTGTGVDIDTCRNNLQKATDDADAFKAKKEADRLHRNVEMNQKIIDALDQSGVRKTVLQKALSNFNALLSEVCKLAEWDEVTVTPDMDCEFGGRPYVLLSASEQFRVRVSLQMVIADLDKSEMLIIDAADILDLKGRAGLLKALHKKQRKTLIAMTMSSIAKAPDLSGKGIGVSYWLENGISAV